MMRVETSLVTDLTDMTDDQLEREFLSQSPQPSNGEDVGQGSDSTQSTDRPRSSDSVTTSSGQSDQSTEDEHGTGDSPNSRSKANKKRHHPSVWKSLRKLGGELNDDTRRVFHAIRGRLQRGHGPHQTKVKAVHILPGEDDDSRWARRLASGSATSHSSSGSDQLSSENS